MIFKLVKYNRYTLFCKVFSQILSRNVHVSGVSPVSDTNSFVDSSNSHFSTKFGRRVRRVSVKVNLEHIEAVRAVLKKHNVDISNLRNKSLIFNDTPWGVEKKIMLLQELGAKNITTKAIVFFQKRLLLPVKMFKAYIPISHEKSMAENFFSYTNCNFDPTEMGISENDQTRKYIHRCLIQCIKESLELDQNQANKLKNKRNQFLIQSVRLFSEVIKFLQNDIKLSRNKIIRHHFTLCSQHPEQLQIIYDLIVMVGKERAHLIVSRYPPIFEHNLEDLKIIVSFLKEHVSHPEKIAICQIIRIFQITSDELKRRFDYFSKNYYTRDLLKHKKFMNLIALYHSVVPRLRYLEEKNLQYCTIQSLTTYGANYHEELANFKSLTMNDMKSFFQINFGDDAEKSLQIFKKHPYYRYVPLLSMRKSLEYLRQKFPYDTIREHSYAMLYNQVDLQAAYEVVTKNPDYCKLPSNQLLSMCLYRIEVNNHFLGDPVLAPGKYAESLKSDVDQGEQISDTKES